MAEKTPDGLLRMPNFERAVANGWIEKRGANYYVVEEHREALDAAYPGDSLYAMPEKSEAE